jgi:hypothetical protein
MLLEDAIGALAGRPDGAGCGAAVAWLSAHPDAGRAAQIAGLVGTHHYRSYAMAAEIVRTAARILSSGAVPAVVAIADVLSAQERLGLVAAAGLGLPGSVGAFVAEMRRDSCREMLAGAPVAPRSLYVGRLDSIVAELARRCQFDRTGDYFILTAARSMMPAAAVAGLESDETPYAASFAALPDSNRRIGELFRQPPAAVLEQHAGNALSSVRLALMVAVACEYLPEIPAPPLYFNSDMGPAAHERPALFGCDNFDCGIGDTVVLMTATETAAFHCVSSAVMGWLHADPRAQELLLAVVSPEQLNPASVFARLGVV